MLKNLLKTEWWLMDDLNKELKKKFLCSARFAQEIEQSVSFQGNFKKLSYELGSLEFESSNPILTNGYVKKPFINLEYENDLGNLKFESSLKLADFSVGILHDYIGYQIHEGKYLLLVDSTPEGSRIFMNNTLKTESSYKDFDMEASIGIKSISYDLKNK